MVAGASGLLHPADRSRDSGQVRPADIHKIKQENVWIHHPIEESAHSLSTRYEVPVGERALRFVELIEVQRQIGILQAHRQFGVPEGEVFTLDQIGLTLLTRSQPSEVPRDRGSVRAQIVATSTRGRARALAQHFSLESDSGLIAVGRAQASLIPQSVYERVRAHARVSNPLSPFTLRQGFSYEEPLQVDTRDPLLTDHPSDHLTAMQAIADVERVARQMVPGAGLRSLKLVFQRYADAEPTPTLRLNISAAGRLSAEVMQLGVRRAKVSGVLDPMEGVR